MALFDENTATVNGVSRGITINTQSGGGNLVNIASHRHSNTAIVSPFFFGGRTRGTNASPTIVANNDDIYNFVFAGWDGTDYAHTAIIAVEVDGVPGNNDMPGRIIFSTSADGSQTPTEALRLDSSQDATFAGDIIISGLVDGRDLSVDGSKLDGIEPGATADQTAADIRGLGFFDITNDGTGSGLDADLLDGNEATAFAPAAHVGAGGAAHADVIAAGASGFMTGADKTKIDGIASGADVSPVASVFTRTGAVTAAASDYDASQIDNDSGVAGAFVDDALDTLGTDLGTVLALHYLGSFTVAGLPSAAANTDRLALATDAGAGRTLVISDGSDWKVFAVEGAIVTT